MGGRKIVAGDVYLIDLSDGLYAFGLVLNSPLVAFFKVTEDELSSPELVQDLPLLFKVWVESRAFSSKKWKKVGKVALRPELLSPTAFFMRDVVSGDLSITYDGTPGPKVSLEDCSGLECAAVWSANHIEDRIRDELVGRPCIWVESIRPK